MKFADKINLSLILGDRIINEFNLSHEKERDRISKIIIDSLDYIMSDEYRKSEYLVGHKTLEEILLEKYCTFYKIDISEMCSDSRKRYLTEKRAHICRALRDHLSLSYRRIGEVLGNKDHSTVLYSCKKSLELTSFDKNSLLEYQNLVEITKEALENSSKGISLTS